MRARFINEKFKQNSDPIKDMNIGMRGINPFGEIDIWVRSSPKRDRKILDDLKLHFKKVDYTGGVSSTGYRVITVYDDNATVEEVTNVLKPYIEKKVLKETDIYYFK